MQLFTFFKYTNSMPIPQSILTGQACIENNDCIKFSFLIFDLISTDIKYPNSSIAHTPYTKFKVKNFK